MKKLFILAALAFALVTGTAVMTVYPQQAIAGCETSNCN
jgi:hypothetical protein